MTKETEKVNTPDVDKQPNNNLKKREGETKEEHLKRIGFQPGQSGNPKGRPEGFNTLFKQAIKKIAKTQTIEECDIEVDMIIKAIAEANSGNFKFYKDIFDRNYGKAKESVDITSGGEKIYNWNYGDNNNIQPKKVDKTTTREPTEVEGSSSTQEKRKDNSIIEPSDQRCNEDSQV